MKKIIHRDKSRGYANHGWLESYHSFSFAGYHDPARIHFGALRVLNDDRVDGGMGFGMHPHDNMEIITIPLSGALQHRDSMGFNSIIKEGDVQIMSAGTGVTHSEINSSSSEAVTFLQIWIFPKEKNSEPRYDQQYFDVEERKNKLQLIVAPEKKGKEVQIMQDAWFWLSNPEKGIIQHYELQDKLHGLYVFVMEGQLSIEGEVLNRRDAIGFNDIEEFTFTAEEDTKMLIMELPMNW
jgi:redox-sensitive bicupin YhaK (pirin superfamily)